MKFDVVIAGGGFAGAYAARALARALGHDQARLRVALIAERNVLVFQPMLAEVAGSSLAPADVVNPLRQFCSGVTVLQGKIHDIDWAKREVIVDGGRFTRNHRVGFGHLAVTMGSVTDLSIVPGMNAYGRPLKNVADALRLRAALINRMEEANLVEDPELRSRLLNFVIVGGGYTGVETAGQVHDLVHEVLPFYSRLQAAEVRVILIHSRGELLAEIGPELGRYAHDALKARGLEILLNTRVVEVTATKVILDQGDPIEATTIISTIGNAPNPVILRLAESAQLPMDRGRLVVEPTLQVAGVDRLWSAGDCAKVPWNDRGEAKFSPPTAQFAMRQGALMGKNIAAALKGQPGRPFKFRYLGQLASIGSREAVAEIFGVRFRGFLAWWLWRSIYLSKLPGLVRKMRVMVDWTFDLVFARDISLILPPAEDTVRSIHLEAGEELFLAGAPCRGVYLVRRGHVQLISPTGEIEDYPAGQVIHREALDAQGCWRGQAVATESSDLVVFREQALELLKEGLELRAYPGESA